MISVIVVTKNSQKHLEQCLDSILIQKLDKPFEIVIVDAASTDKTLRILLNTLEKAKIKNINFIFKNVPSETTIGKARQIGLENSNYEILAYIDSDVELPHKNWLKNMSEVFSHSITSFCYHDTLMAQPEEIAGVQTLAKCRESDPKILKKIHNSFKYTRSIIGKDNYETVGTSHILLKKSIIQEVGGFIDSSFGEDADLCIKIANKGYKFIYLDDEKCYHYHVDNYWDYIKKVYRNKKYAIKLRPKTWWKELPIIRNLISIF